MRHYSRAEMELVYDSIVGQRLPGAGEQPITAVSAVQNFVLGSKRQIDQSIYRYGLAGAANLGLGELCQMPVPGANHHDLVPSANYVAGVTMVELTLGATGLNANEMAGGWLFVNDGTGQGQVMRIISHPAALATAVCMFTLADPVTLAFNAANTLCALAPNPYSLAIVHPSPPTAKLVGVPVAAIVAGSFGWFQTRGPAAILTDGVVYIYQQVRASTGVNGAVSHAILEIATSNTAAGAEDANGRLLEDSAGADLTIALSGLAGTVPAEAVFDIGSLVTIIGRVMRVEVTGDYSLIDLALE